MPIHQVSKFQSRPITNRGLTSRPNGSTTVLWARWSTSREVFSSRTSPSYVSGMPSQLIDVQLLMIEVCLLNYSVEKFGVRRMWQTLHKN